MAGSIRSLRKPRSRARVRSSSALASRLYPTTSAAKIAASLRVSAIRFVTPLTRRHHIMAGGAAKLIGPSKARLRGAVVRVVAPNGHAEPHDECRLSGVKLKWLGHRQTDAIDPGCVKTLCCCYDSPVILWGN